MSHVVSGLFSALSSFRRPLLFLVASVSSTVTDVALFFVLVRLSGAIIVPNIISYCCGILVAFSINRRLAFGGRAETGSFVAEGGKFFLASTAGLAVSTLAVHGMTPLIGPFFAKLASLPLTFLVNYLLSLTFVFGMTKSRGHT